MPTGRSCGSGTHHERRYDATRKIVHGGDGRNERERWTDRDVCPRNYLAYPEISLEQENDFLNKFLSLGVAAEHLREVQASGELVIIPSAEALKIEHDPVYVIDRRGDEDLTCAGLIVLAMLCLMLFLVYLFTGAF